MKLFTCVVCLCALVYAALAVNIDTGAFVYDCRRSPASACGSGTCNSQTGACSCGTTGAGRDCSIPFGSTPTNVPQCNCLQGSTCYTSFNVFRCDCLPGWTGNDCNTCRVSLQCDTNRMDVVIIPQNLPFTGHLDFIAPTGQVLTQCRLPTTTTTFPNPWTGSQYNLQLGIDGVTQSVCPQALDTRGNGARCYTLQMRYNSIIRTFLDETFTLCCDQTGGNVASAGVTVSPSVFINGVSPISLTGSIISVTGQFIYTASNTPIPNGALLNIGDDISFYIQRPSNVPDFRVHSCQIENGLSPIQILDVAGCPIRSSYGIFKNLRKSTNIGSAGVYIDMEAFALENTNEIVMTCQMQTCGGNICPLSFCPNNPSFQNIGRRRREASNETDTEKRTEIEIETGEATAKYKIRISMTDECPAQTTCNMHEVFLPVAIVFGVLLLAAIIVTAFLCFKMSKMPRREDRPARSPPEYYNPAIKA